MHRTIHFTFGRRAKPLIRKLLNWLSPRTRNVPAANWLLSQYLFVGRLGRFPRSPNDANAELYDVLLDRMVHDRWDRLHRSCTDKVTAKDVAGRLAPELRIAKTEAVLDVDERCTVRDIEEMLRPYFGKPLVAKPTHASGGFMDLSVPLVPERLALLHRTAIRDYFHVLRETQYCGLPKRIIVEENLVSESGLPDYKFFCIFGTPLATQIDFDRFEGHRRAVMHVDGFRWQPGRFGASHILPATSPPQKPASWELMVTIAQALSEPFDFVRVDLYDTPRGAFFSEFTFTPDAGTAFADSVEMSRLLNSAWKSSVKMPQHTPIPPRSGRA